MAWVKTCRRCERTFASGEIDRRGFCSSCRHAPATDRPAGPEAAQTAARDAEERLAPGTDGSSAEHFAELERAVEVAREAEASRSAECRRLERDRAQLRAALEEASRQARTLEAERELAMADISDMRMALARKADGGGDIAQRVADFVAGRSSHGITAERIFMILDLAREASGVREVAKMMGSSEGVVSRVLAHFDPDLRAALVQRGRAAQVGKLVAQSKAGVAARLAPPAPDHTPKRVTFDETPCLWIWSRVAKQLGERVAAEPRTEAEAALAIGMHVGDEGLERLIAQAAELRAAA
ncbi:hypothetical protein P2H44_19965 [Albimonas sp. CAU 1670]|uniref:hypothetical protein n=1 Tax=Albimonas sp. CAU 1670 TaxID=3032599 RepID=UPI0023DB2B5D|nr:hypothetical protein [Albimonas sp. CAU 1670]MDF2234843.1 hypothetical protein [Albimonas sp. CAU 1670]